MEEFNKSNKSGAGAVREDFADLKAETAYFHSYADDSPPFTLESIGLDEFGSFLEALVAAPAEAIVAAPAEAIVAAPAEAIVAAPAEAIVAAPAEAIVAAPTTIDFAPSNISDKGTVMLDINLFRANPEIIRESQRRRFANVEVVDEIIMLDIVWRQCRYEFDCVRKEFNKLNKEVSKLKISGAEATEQIQQLSIIKQHSTEKEAAVREAFAALNAKLGTVGNLVNDSVPVSRDEENNMLHKVWGERRVASPGEELKNHVDLVELLNIVDTKRGAAIAGARGFVLKGHGARLKRALINYALNFLDDRKFTEMHPPFFMRNNVMAKCAQLAQFDEELYKLTGEGDDKYLIATAEQPLCAYHQDEWIPPTELPKRYAGYSTCFRKEAGSHGRDTLGIFRVHQFDKVEQFCITNPNDSWAMLEDMLKNSEDFYQLLKIPYQIVLVVSGVLNDAAAKKYDLEAWFPAAGTYRELVSCSNCTDYQARRLGIRYGHKKNNEETQQYVHMLNSTLTAAERTICCILETYQRENGVDIPEVLQPFMNGVTFLPFKAKPLVAKMSKKSKG